MTDNNDNISKLSIISANVCGFGQKHKRLSFFLKVKSYTPDIILLSDTRLDENSEKVFINEIDYHCIFNSLTSEKWGVAILLKKSLSITHSVIYRDNNGNILTIKIEYDEQTFLISSIYGPNLDDPQFFQCIFDRNSNNDCHMQLLGGDLNVTLNHEIDNHAYAAPRNINARAKLNDLLDEHNFYDVYRNFNPYKKEYTWKNSGGRQKEQGLTCS